MHCSALHRLLHRLQVSPPFREPLYLLLRPSRPAHILLLLPFLLLFLAPRLHPPPPSIPAPRASFATSLLHSAPPSTSGVILLVETHFNGLGAQLLRHLDAMALSDHLGWAFSPCFGRYWNYGCAPFRAWQCYFTNSSPAVRACARREQCSELAGLRPEEIRAKKCVVVATKESVERAARVMERRARGGVALPRRLAGRLWTLNGETRARVDEVLRKVGVPEGGAYVGVHVRRGDKGKEVPRVPIERYAAAVRLLSGGDEPVFVASDDGTAVAELRALLPGRRLLAVSGASARTGHDQAEMNRRYLKRNYGRVVELLGEVEALAGARVFVGTFSSNLGRLVHVLRKGEANSSVSLDYRWRTGVAWRSFGQPYCQAEDANKVYCESLAMGTG